MCRSRTDSILSLTVVWVLLIPTLFFTARGTFSFDRSATNNQFAVDMGSMSGAWNSGATIRVEQATVYILLCLLITPLFSKCIQTLISPSSAVLMTLPIWALSSILWSQSPAKTALAAGMIILLTLFSVYLTERFDEQRQMRFFQFVGWVALVASIGIVFALPKAGIANFGDIGAWQGLFGHKNHCAIVMTYLIAPSLCLTSKSGVKRSLRWLYVTGAVALIIMTRSRTGWLLLSAMLLYFAVASTAKRIQMREKALFMFVAFCGVAVGSAFVCLYFSEVSMLLGKSASISGRTGIWKAILPALRGHQLLGYGYRAFWLGTQGASGSVALSAGYLGLANAENSVLEMWLELGAVGVGLMLFILLVSAKNAFICVMRAPSTYITWCSANVFLTFLALVDGDKIMYPNTIEWILFVVSYIALAEKARGLKNVNCKLLSRG